MSRHVKGVGKLYEDGQWVADLAYDFEIVSPDRTVTTPVRVVEGNELMLGGREYKLVMHDGRECDVIIDSSTHWQRPDSLLTALRLSFLNMAQLFDDPHAG